MVRLADRPQDQIRSQSHQQILLVRQGVTRLRHGGTATDIREAVADLTGEILGVRTVRRILWLLYALGHVDLRDDGHARWWSSHGEYRRKDCGATGSRS